MEALTNKEKIDVLIKIYNIFNKNNILWALGGSLNLCFRNIVSDFNDIDIVINLKDSKKVEELLMKIGDKEPSKDKGIYNTTYFGEFKIDGVEVDIMSEVHINNSSFCLSLRKEDIDIYNYQNKYEIPLHSLDVWLEFYRQIGRSKKVEIIENYLKK